ncbi:hypothetical protein D1872_292350 [compost metagenome]
MLELACRKLSLRVERTVVIGDTNGDMRMGKAAGAGLCIGLASQPPERGEPAELFPDADVLVESYSSLTLRRGSGAGLEHLGNSFGGEGEVQR